MKMSIVVSALFRYSMTEFHVLFEPLPSFHMMLFLLVRVQSRIAPHNFTVPINCKLLNSISSLPPLLRQTGFLLKDD